MKLQKTLVYFNTSIRGNEVMIGRLKKPDDELLQVADDCSR